MFKYRLISFPLLLALAFLVVFGKMYGAITLMVLSVPVAAMAVWESCNIAGKLGLAVSRALALVFAAFVLLKYGIGAAAPADVACLPDWLTLTIFLFAILMLKTLFCSEKNRTASVAAALVTPGVVLFALLPVVALMRIYMLFGAQVFLALILATKASDTGGYIVGMLSNRWMKNGNHKIVPSISPKKSWEGTVGAALFSIGVAFLMVHFECITLNWWETALFGFFAFLGSFAGDLTESQLKRVANIKDSANWIPGMGGILDVLDSFIYNAPIFYLVLKNGVLICQ